MGDVGSSHTESSGKGLTLPTGLFQVTTRQGAQNHLEVQLGVSCPQDLSLGAFFFPPHPGESTQSQPSLLRLMKFFNSAERSRYWPVNAVFPGGAHPRLPESSWKPGA